MQFKTLNDIEALNGLFESKVLEFKKEIPSTDKLLKSIHSIVNGDEPVGHIIIGIPQDINGKADTKNLTAITFPFEKIGNFDEYKRHLLLSLQNYLPDYLEGMINIEQMPLNNGILIIITVFQSKLRPHSNKKNEYFKRRDGFMSPMSEHEKTIAIQELTKRQITDNKIQPNIKSNETELADYQEFICSDEALTKLIPWGNIKDAKDFKFTKSPYCFLYLSPLKQNNFNSNELKDKLRDSNLGPFGQYSSVWYERNKYGAISFNASMHDQGLTSNFTQLFSTGSIIGIESLALSSGARDFDFLATTYIEEMYTRALKHYLNFAKSKLNLTVPLEIVTGLTGVKRFCLALPPSYFDRFGGHIYDNEVISEVTIDSYEDNIEDILKPFFEKIWKSAGLTRPNKTVITS